MKHWKKELTRHELEILTSNPDRLRKSVKFEHNEIQIMFGILSGELDYSDKTGMYATKKKQLI